MQYSFAYMYFMMQELKPFDLGEFWSLMDTNQDGCVGPIRQSREAAEGLTRMGAH